MSLKRTLQNATLRSKLDVLLSNDSFTPLISSQARMQAYSKWAIKKSLRFSESRGEKYRYRAVLRACLAFDI